MGELEQLENVAPADIERRSFQIIGAELAERGISIPAENELVVKRAIHASADFDYASNLVFSPGAVRTGIDAIRQGTDIVTDTKMAAAGINKRTLARFGGQVLNFISDDDVAAEAKRLGVTRSAMAMRKAARLSDQPGKPGTAGSGDLSGLTATSESAAQSSKPLIFIVAVPVGFVNVVPSKELILQLDVPHIVACGRKGGSNVAAAIVNALLYQA